MYKVAFVKKKYKKTDQEIFRIEKFIKKNLKKRL